MLGVAAALFLLLGNPANLAAVDFAAARSYPVGTSPAGFVVGDFNGDGKPDIAVANTGSSNVSILLGNDDGTFQPAMNFSTGNSPTVIALGDFNRDGKLDLAVFQPAGNGVAGSVSVLLGNGDGTFQAPRTLALSQSAFFMDVADFNLDNKLDLAVSDSDSAGAIRLNIFLGNGDGTFQAAKQTTLPSGGLFFADFNGDGKPDIAVENTSSKNLSILLGNGDGTFQAAKQTALPSSTVGLAAADFNGDSKADVAVATAAGIMILLGNGDGTFSQGVTRASSLPAEGVFTADVNHDGKLDLVVTSSRTDSCGTSCSVIFTSISRLPRQW